MKSLKEFEEKTIKIEKSKLSHIQGGTSTTVMIEAGDCRSASAENEYEDDGNGCPDYDKEAVLVS